jgi:MFS family permease
MAEDLHGTSIEAFWTATSFLLASTIFQPTFTQLSHILGRKPVLLVALALFTIGAIIGGWAKNFTVILVGRVIQGTGSAGILSLTSVIVTDMVSLRERGKWIGLISTQWAIGSIAGPISGGGLSSHVSWVSVLMTNFHVESRIADTNLLAFRDGYSGSIFLYVPLHSY